MPRSENAIEVEGLSKAYRIYAGPWKRIVEAATLGRARRHQEFWALKDIAFDLRPGSSMGLCGANGAGKSTLMKILAGTTAPTRGRFRLNGRVASLLELGAGFHDDFTGRSNIFLNGIMMGFTRREIEAKVDEIIDFAELGAHIDEPVRTYSSGMGLRLGFSIAVAVDPEILIIDEVFAVGDMYFQKKCVDKIYAFKERNKTILFCSHSLYDIRQLCDTAIWLDHGECRALGPSVQVTQEYTTFQRGHIGESQDVLDGAFPASAPDLSDPERRRLLPKVVDARVYRMGTDKECYEIRTGDDIEIRIWWSNPDPERQSIHLGTGFLRQDTTTCAGFGTHFSGLELDGPTGCAVLRIPDFPLLAGQYLIPVILLDGEGVHKYQEFLVPENLVVRVDTKDLGLFKMKHEWDLCPELPAPQTKAADTAAEASVGEAG